MFSSALVALDLSPAEAPILECLPDLLKWGINKITLTHVIQVGYNQFAGYGHEDDYQIWLEKCAAPLRAAGIDVDIALRTSGSIAVEILNVAAAVDAKLLVIGSRGQNQVRSLFLGSVAREVIRRTTRSVLLEWVEPSAEATRERCEAVCQHTLDHVLLATDLSRHARGAQNAFVELATSAIQIDLLTVMTAEDLNRTPAWPIMVEAALNDICKRLPPRSKDVIVLMEEGKPCDTIAQVAADRDCSLIIVGKQGQGWLESKVIGSTAARLCETAQRPVLMVPSQEQDKA